MFALAYLLHIVLIYFPYKKALNTRADSEIPHYGHVLRAFPCARPFEYPPLLGGEGVEIEV